MTDRHPTPPGEAPTKDCSLIQRRTFLAGLGSTLVLAACSGRSIGVFAPDPTSTTLAGAGVAPLSLGAPAGRTLVIVEMGGGNDGLNMVVPHADSRYYDLRRSLRIEDPIDLDGEIGLHPNLGALARRYRDGAVAIVEGVGVPDPDLSHFVSMDTWWTGRPDSSDQSGWLGRYLDGTVGYGQPLAGITIGPGPSKAMLGHGSFTVTIQDETGLTPRIPPWIDSTDELMATWEGFAGVEANAIDLDPIRAAIAATATARAELTDAIGSSPDRPRPARRALSEDLVLAAQLVASPAAPAVVYVHGFGDFDTHQGEAARHAALMRELDDAIDAFFTRISQLGAGDRVVLLTASEFGRRPRDNGSGTDHGTAAAHLVIGQAVTGGRYGSPLDLKRLDTAGNPPMSIDFRATYATMLSSWLGADAPSILDGDFETLPLFT